MGLPQLAISVIKLIVSNKSLIINQILDLLKKFERGCPIPSELERIIKIRNEIVELLTQMRDEINKVNVIIKPLNETLPILDTTISILKLIPIPTAIGGVGVPMNVPIVYGDILAISKSTVTFLSSNVGAFSAIKDFIVEVIDEILILLNQLDAKIENCAAEFVNLSNSTDLNDLTILDNIANNPQNGALNNLDNNNTLINNINTPISKFTFTNLTNVQNSPLINALQNEKPTPINSYKGFKFEILIDDTNKTRFPKQYAVAKTPAGVIVLQSESSFTASPQVLIKELIYVIDRDDLKL
jgi:hypothetical protein